MVRQLGVLGCVAAVAAALAGGQAARGQADDPGAPQRLPVLRQPGGSPNSNLKPAPQATIFNPNTNVKGAIDAAVARGGPERRRVLVIWGDNASRWALRVEEHLAIPDTARMIRNDYELVTADVSESGTGPLNRALAQVYGAKPDSGRHPIPQLTVIETFGEKAGQAIVNASSELWMRPGSTRNTGEYFALKVQDFLAANRAPALDATEVRAAAVKKASESRRNALVYFHDLEDPWCWKFARWLKEPRVAEILGKHFVVCTVEPIRMMRGGEEFDRLGGGQSEAAPWYIVLDPKAGEGTRIAPDRDKGEKDYGFPTGDEVERFVKMLRRISPRMSEEEAGEIAGSLRAAAGSAAK